MKFLHNILLLLEKFHNIFIFHNVCLMHEFSFLLNCKKKLRLYVIFSKLLKKDITETSKLYISNLRVNKAVLFEKRIHWAQKPTFVWVFLIGHFAKNLWKKKVLRVSKWLLYISKISYKFLLYTNILSLFIKKKIKKRAIINKFWKFIIRKKK